VYIIIRRQLKVKLKAYGVVDVEIHIFLEVSSQLHAPAALPPRENPPGTHWIGGLVEATEKRNFLTLPGLEFDPSVVQPVASRCTDYNIPAPLKVNCINKLKTSKIQNKLVQYLYCDSA
jgi:hypothetical protein